MPIKNKTFGWKAWTFILIGIGIFAAVILTHSATASRDEQTFKEEFFEKAASMNLKIVEEHSCWSSLDDLPVLMRLSAIRFSPRPRLEIGPARDGTVALLVQDTQNKSQYEIDIHYIDDQVLAVIVRCANGNEKGAVRLKDNLEKEFTGLRVLLRSGFLLTQPNRFSQ